MSKSTTGTVLTQAMDNMPRRIENPRDPPGQRSIYILPGDYRDRRYRLLTFKDFPKSDIDVYTLSKQGYYYTGYKDRVKCFSCSVAVENLRSGNNFSQYHDVNCEFMNGDDALTDRWNTRQSTSQDPIPQTSSTAAPQVPVTAGEVLRGHINGGTPPLSSTATVRQRPVPQPNNSISTNHADRNSESIPQSNMEFFPCRQPINPHMRNREARLQTFAERATNWPAHRINATPREITEAGFYYLGESDRVKCWYCNGGLQNWERNDHPWEEHAKWFPMCEYVLQQKGAQYVHQIVSSTPNLRRPTLGNPARNVDFPNFTTRRSSLIDPSYSTTAAPSGPQIIDPREKINEQQRKIEQEMTSSELVNQARLMGFKDGVILAALKRQYQEHDSGFSTFESIIDAILQHENNDNIEEEEEEQNTHPKEPPKVPTTSQEELKQLEDSRKCKVCRKEDACVVFVPCGHLAVCNTCGNTVNRCPVCRSFIKERIRSYLS